MEEFWSYIQDIESVQTYLIETRDALNILNDRGQREQAMEMYRSLTEESQIKFLRLLLLMQDHEDIEPLLLALPRSSCQETE